MVMVFQVPSGLVEVGGKKLAKTRGGPPSGGTVGSPRGAGGSPSKKFSLFRPLTLNLTLTWEGTRRF